MNIKDISAEQATMERQVYERLNKRDEVTVHGFAEHCEFWIGKDDLLPLLIAIIELDDRRWPFLRADMRVHCPNLAAAFDKVIDHVEKHRAEFIEDEACQLLSSIKGE